MTSNYKPPYRPSVSASETTNEGERVVTQTKTSGADLIAAERQRQIEVEGWTPDHDQGHAGHPLSHFGFPPLVAAAFTYVSAGAHPRALIEERQGMEPPASWPWEGRFWKPTPDDRVRELVKAGALLAAEIDRLQAAANDGSHAHG